MLMADAEGKSISLPPEKRPAVWLVLDFEPGTRGSLETELVTLAARLSLGGARATFVFSRPAPAWMAAALAGCGAETRVLDFRRPAAAVLAFSRLMEAARPALVHFHFVRAHSPLVAIARAAGARVILHDHVAPPAPARRRAVRSLFARGYQRARAAALHGFVDRRIAVSRFVAERVRAAEHVAVGKLTVVEPGVELSRFAAGDGAPLRAELRAGAGRKIVACVSPLGADKGIDVLIAAMARVGRDALLVIAGDGPEAGVCRARATALALRDHVRFVGRRDDVERVYAAADIVVMPSLSDEPEGLAVVEAMASSRPVVVTAAGALPELVAGGVGVVVPKRDEVALSGAIGRLLDDDALRARMGDKARAQALARFSLPVWVERIMTEYAALCPALASTARRAA